MITDRKILGKVRNIAKRYSDYFFEPVATVEMEYAETREHFRSPSQAADAGLDWKPAAPGTTWGQAWYSAWFRGDAILPAECNGRPVFVRPATGAHESLFFVDNEPMGVVDGNHPVVRVTGRGKKGDSHQIALESYAGGLNPGAEPGARPFTPPDFTQTFSGAELVLAREDVIAFVMDLRVLLGLIEALPEDSLRRSQVMVALAEVFEIVDSVPWEREEESWRPKLALARKAMKPLLDKKNSDTTPFMGLIGHSHIDTAWLWTLAETQRKAARTFSSMVNLMDQYSEVTFFQSAPCHAEWIRDYYPGLFKRIQQLARAGRWEPNGAMWVEPDCNVPSGEALVRQLLVGQTSTREMFGYTSDSHWLPDVFGYSASLPQILQKSGVRYFLTTKISWNDTTRFPFDTFTWKGVDGTSVIAHYHGIHNDPAPAGMTGAWKYLQHMDVQDRKIAPFGHGDGGGGPMFEMMETARRIKDLEGCPRADYTTVGDFMQKLEADLGEGLPLWCGELYLEGHRGTLTSIAGIKRGNRKSEIAMREAELLATRAALAGACDYPAQPLLALWKSLLTNQFHDILPGSSIAEVNDEAIEEFARIVQAAGDLAAEAVRALQGAAPPRPRALMLANSLSWDRQGEIVIDAPAENLVPAGEGLTTQPFTDLDGNARLAVDGLRLPALGATCVELEAAPAPGKNAPPPFKVRKQSLETPFARVRFDRAGRIVSLVDKIADRDIVRPGGALNTFWIGEDVPESWDNWDIDFDQQQKMEAETRLVEREVIAEGPLQLRIRSRYQLGPSSTLAQDMVFHATTPRIDFETVVDWSEKHMLLKAGFELDVLADTVRNEIQYGHIERPNHRNQMADRARFEICNHKWTDISENGYGVALLNDCKYGISAFQGDLRLTLIKSGTRPDTRGDAGRHAFTYSLLPHAEGFSVPAVVRPGYELNIPVAAYPVKREAEPMDSLLRVDADNVIVESVKWAEKGKAFVVRLYEAGRTGTWTGVEFGVPVRMVTETNMLEEEPEEVKLGADRTRLYFRPFEIKTLRVQV